MNSIQVNTLILIFCFFVMYPNTSFGQLFLNLEKDKKIINEHQVETIQVKYFSEDETDESNGTVIAIREFDDKGNLTLEKDFNIFDGGFWTIKEYQYKNGQLDLATEKYKDYPKEYKLYKYDENKLLKTIETYKDSLYEKLHVLENFEYNDSILVKYKHDQIGNKRICVHQNREEILSYDDQGRLKEKKIVYTDNCYVLKQSYEYDGIGNLIQDSRTDGKGINEVKEYSWNKKKQLIGEIKKGRKRKEKKYKYTKDNQVKLEERFSNGKATYKIINEFNSKKLLAKRTWDGLFDKKVYCIIEYSFNN